MRGVWALAMASACNWFYGMDPTQLVDAPGPDAAPRCTTTSAPSFSSSFTQAVLDDCNNYTIHEGTGLAACGLDTDRYFLEGPVDGPLKSLAIAPSQPGRVLVAPRLTPEGELIVHQLVPATSLPIASIYRRSDEGWTWARDLPFSLQPTQRVGVPSGGPRRHIMISRQTSIDEAIEDGDGNFTMRTQATTDFGVSAVRFNAGVHLSADGLRAVFSSTDGVRYAVRDDIGRAFSGSFRIELDASDAFMTEDCARLYFSGLGSIFYVTQ